MHFNSLLINVLYYGSWLEIVQQHCTGWKFYYSSKPIKKIIDETFCCES